MPTSESNLWRDLLEIRQVLKEVAIRHNIHDEDDDAHILSLIHISEPTSPY